VNHELEPWEFTQLSAAGRTVRSFLSSDQKSREEEKKGLLRNQLFDLLYQHKIECIKAKKELPHPQPKALATALYEISGADYLKEPARRETNLRAIKQGLKQSLERFEADYCNKRLPWSFQLIEGKYKLDAVRQDSAMKAFWAPYFTQPDPQFFVTIAYGENVFFRGGKRLRTFIRHMDVNDTKALNDIYSKCELPSDWVLLPGGTQFVSAGDCAAVIKLGQRFERNGLRTEVKTAEDFSRWSAQKQEGLIVLGNGRTLPWIARHLTEEKFAYQLSSNGIIDTRPNGGEHVDVFSPGIPVRGIISRTYSKNLRCWLTVISNNHARCSQAWVDYVLSENNMTRLFEWISSDSLPDRFQIVVDVPVDPTEAPRAPEGVPPVSLIDYVGSSA
jgi:hypothetical protein